MWWIGLLSFLFLSISTTIYAAPRDSNSCKIIPTDKEWPTKDVWEKALPGIEPRGEQDPKKKHPDYQLIATSIEQVQAAVKFAVDHNIRLTILNSGHDFLGRSVELPRLKNRGVCS